MKKCLLIIICVLGMLLILKNIAYNGTYEEDIKIKIEKIKQHYNFNKWSSKSDKILTKKPLSIDSFPYLIDVKEVWRETGRVEEMDRISVSVDRYYWRVNEEDRIQIRIAEAKSSSEAHEYLVLRWANTSLGTVGGKEKGSDKGVAVGDLCYVASTRDSSGFVRIDFIRNNIVVIIDGEGNMRKVIKDIAETIDSILIK